MRTLLISLVVSATLVGGPLVNLSDQEIALLGKTIWKSECNGTQEGLLTWNDGEFFPSLGIGHFIWYPADASERTFSQTFPDLIRFMQIKKAEIPHWLISQVEIGCPWSTKKQFLDARNTTQMVELKTLLANTVDLQARFIVSRFESELSLIISSAPATHRATVEKIITSLSKQYKGMFALIDYVHFKGTGTNSSESYQGQTWGLLSVLLNMNPSCDDLLSEFVRAAKATLEQRVALAPNKEQEQKWLKGWLARVDRYLIG